MKKEFTIKRRDKEVTFVPVQYEMNLDSPKPTISEPFALPFGQYDINFVITFCRILIDKIDRLKFNPRDLPFTLTQSLKKLLAMLEVERDQMK
jgi:hypothetical protein